MKTITTLDGQQIAHAIADAARALPGMSIRHMAEVLLTYEPETKKFSASVISFDTDKAAKEYVGKTFNITIEGEEDGSK